jgi:hypothetical protein
VYFDTLRRNAGYIANWDMDAAKWGHNSQADGAAVGDKRGCWRRVRAGRFQAGCRGFFDTVLAVLFLFGVVLPFSFLRYLGPSFVVRVCVHSCCCRLT